MPEFARLSQVEEHDIALVLFQAQHAAILATFGPRKGAKFIANMAAVLDSSPSNVFRLSEGATARGYVKTRVAAAVAYRETLPEVVRRAEELRALTAGPQK